jgi:pimeloyl-ACP methyl ester carboxylesterase
MEVRPMSTVRTNDGVQLSYQTRGQGPRNLLFMHGWGGSGAYFDELLKYVDLSGLRAITFDFRGHGDSDKADHGYTLDRFAQDAFEVADAAGAERVIVVGYSMSGKFGQYLACLRPERVDGQILLSGAPAGPIPLPDETVRDWVGRAGDRDRLREVMAMFTSQPVAPEVLDRCAIDATRATRTALGETLNMCTQTTFADQLGGLRIPTLVVGGASDPIFSPEVLRHAVAAPIAGARLALLDSNHEIPIERPRELAAVIEGFLAGLGLAESTAHVTDRAALAATR